MITAFLAQNPPLQRPIAGTDVAACRARVAQAQCNVDRLDTVLRGTFADKKAAYPALAKTAKKDALADKWDTVATLSGIGALGIFAASYHYVYPLMMSLTHGVPFLAGAGTIAVGALAGVAIPPPLACAFVSTFLTGGATREKVDEQLRAQRQGALAELRNAQADLTQATAKQQTANASP